MKTIALNMIVGPGESQELDRCLSLFDVSKTFDEIVIVLTTSDPNVAAVARKYTSKVFDFKWSTPRHPYGNFAGARNAALRNTVSDYVMWLDADDVPSEGFADRFKEIREVIEKNNFDFFTMDYEICAGIKTKRERIFKRIPALFWQFPVHEQLSISGSMAVAYLKGASIVHAPVKAPGASVGRNLSILEHEHERFPTTQLSFYYGKELKNSGQVEKGIKVLREVLDSRNGTADMMSQAANIIAMHHFDAEEFKTAETYFRIAMSFNYTYAENYVLLGQIYENRGDLQGASKFYGTALKCNFEGGGLYREEYYNLIPALRLMQIFRRDNQPEMALLYSRKVIECDRNNQAALYLRKKVAEEILAQCQA